MTVGVRESRIGSSRTDAKKWSCEIPFAPARDDVMLLKVLGRAMERYRTQVRFKPRAVSVMLHGLELETRMQGDLFADSATGGVTADRALQSAPCAQVRRKRERLSDTLDTLRRAHGPAAATLGPKTDVPGGYLGAKIAFGRIPDLDDFNDSQSEDGATHFCSL